jgi:hypothetical protein
MPQTQQRPSNETTRQRALASFSNLVITAPGAEPNASPGDIPRGILSDNPPTLEEAPEDCGTSDAPQGSVDARSQYRDAQRHIHHGTRAGQSRYMPAEADPDNSPHKSDASSLPAQSALLKQGAEESFSYQTSAISFRGPPLISAAY